MRRSVRIALLVTAFAAAAGVLPARADDQTVAAVSSSFSPAVTALRPGETLTIEHQDGPVAHSLKFDDEATRRQEAGTGWTVTRTFGAAEARGEPYGFFCHLHLGMSGRVYVNADGTVPTPPPAPPPPPPGAPPPPPGAPPPPPGAPPPPPGPVQVPELRSASLASRVACARRGPRCRRPGVTLRVDLSAPADVRGRLRRRAPGKRRFRRFGAVDFGRVAAGPQRLRFVRTTAGRRLKPGRYRLALEAAGSRRTLAFRVRG